MAEQPRCVAHIYRLCRRVGCMGLYGTVALVSKSIVILVRR